MPWCRTNVLVLDLIKPVVWRGGSGNLWATFYLTTFNPTSDDTCSLQILTPTVTLTLALPATSNTAMAVKRLAIKGGEAKCREVKNPVPVETRSKLKLLNPSSS